MYIWQLHGQVVHVWGMAGEQYQLCRAHGVQLHVMGGGGKRTLPVALPRQPSPSSRRCSSAATATAQRPQRSTIKVVVNGAGKELGLAAVAAISNARGMEVAGAVDSTCVGEDVGTLAGLQQPLEIPVLDDLVMVLGSLSQSTSTGVMVDFTQPDAVYDNVRQAGAFGLRSVVAVPGMDQGVVSALSTFCDKASTGCIIAPTLSIGALLLQQAATSAAFMYKHVEIVESASEPKGFPSVEARVLADSLSGLGQIYNHEDSSEVWPSRGEVLGDGVRVHSMVLPGLRSSLDVRFSGPGEVLSFKHDVTDPRALMPGLLLAIRKVVQLKSLVLGLDKVL